MKIFIIDWNAQQESFLANECAAFGHEVQCEFADGAEAYRKTGVWMPDMILVNYAVKPSHGRITIESIRKRKKTESIPVYFVVKEVKEDAQQNLPGEVFTWPELKQLLQAKK